MPEPIFLQSANFLQKYKIEQTQMVNTNLPNTSSCSIFKSNLIIPFKGKLKKLLFVLCNLSYIYFFESLASLPFPLLTVRHIFEISEEVHHEP